MRIDLIPGFFDGMVPARKAQPVLILSLGVGLYTKSCFMAKQHSIALFWANYICSSKEQWRKAAK